MYLYFKTYWNTVVNPEELGEFREDIVDTCYLFTVAANCQSDN